MGTIQLSSIEQSPNNVPAWELIIEDLGSPPAERIARVLGVGRSTVYRWQQDGTGPRIACLALFWLTRWGRSAVHTQATNDALMAVQLARSLTEERDRVARDLARLDDENRQLAYALASKALPAAHGNDAIGNRSHTDTPSADSSAGVALPGPRSLAWPALALAPEAPGPWPVLSDLLEHRQGSCVRPGSPAGLPPEAHSARFRELERIALPQPSGLQEDGRLLPLSAISYRNDAIVASQCGDETGPVLLVRTETSPRAARVPAEPPFSPTCRALRPPPRKRGPPR